MAIVTSEGQLTNELSQAVLEGTRRPRGHLIPQSLLAHEGHKDGRVITVIGALAALPLKSPYNNKGTPASS